MKITTKSVVICSIAFLTQSASLLAADTFNLNITNGGPMPVSPAVIYVRTGQASAITVANAPTPGFIKLCQTGDNSLRLAELKEDKSVRLVETTGSPIMPRSSLSAEISVNKSHEESIHFEAMYGKTKDVCAVLSVNSHSLFALKQHVTTEILARENVLASGAFLDPALAAGYGEADDTCSAAENAVSCLRALALPNTKEAKVRFFTSYLPSVVNFLETKYGAAEAQTLLVPTSGAVELRVSLKH